jgi:ABC-2 type transport system permease protein
VTAPASTARPERVRDRSKAIGRSPAAVWWHAYRHHLRLLRNAAIAWTASLAIIGAGVVATFEDRIPTEAERAALMAMEGVPVFEVLSGRYVQIGTVEGFTLSRWGMFAIGVAVWGMLTGVRLLRSAEEVGHLEPLRAGLVTPRGLLTAALAAAFTTHGLFALAVAAGHGVAGMDSGTSWALGVSMGLLAAVFAAAGALASQLATSAQRAMALASGFLGVTLALRFVAAASGTPDWVWWTTPFGWVGHLHEVDGARPLVIASLASALAAMTVPSLVLARRDLHGGWLGETSAAAGALRSPRGHVGLAWHQIARPAAAWSAAVAAIGFLFGILVNDFVAAMAELPGSTGFLLQIGWLGIETPEGILAMTFMFPMLLLTLFAAGQAAAIRDEEASWRLEHLLVRPLSRSRWLVTRAVGSALAVAVVAISAALAAFIGTNLTGVALRLNDALALAVNMLPLGWVFLGLGIGLAGAAPRVAGAVTFSLAILAFVLDFVGAVLGLPEAVIDLSPYRHLAAVPATEIAVGPAVVMLLVGGGCAALGIAAFSRRDLQEA